MGPLLWLILGAEALLVIWVIRLVWHTEQQNPTEDIVPATEADVEQGQVSLEGEAVQHTLDELVVAPVEQAGEHDPAEPALRMTELTGDGTDQEHDGPLFQARRPCLHTASQQADVRRGPSNAEDFTLSPTSTRWDLGDPSILDPDGSISQMGAYSRPGGNW